MYCQSHTPIRITEDADSIEVQVRVDAEAEVEEATSVVNERKVTNLSSPCERTCHTRTTRQIPSRLFLVYIVLMSILKSTVASVRCFNTEEGNILPGAEYHRTRNMDHLSCAVDCRDDPSCLAYEWRSSSRTCYLKARSLSGALKKSEDGIVGFCLDEDDETRDRFRDHVIEGPVVAKSEGVEDDTCRSLCMQYKQATIYSWTPEENDSDEATTGNCTCIEAIRALNLQYNSFSGFLPPRERRLKFRFG